MALAASAHIALTFDELFLETEGTAPAEAKATAVKAFFVAAEFVPT